MIDVLIPTMGRGTICTTISALLTSKKIKSIIILDSGDMPVMENSEFRVLFDLCRMKGIDVLLKRNICSIGKARADLIELSSAPYLLFIDDDVYLTGENLDKMHERYILTADSLAFVTPCNWIVTDYLGVEGLNREALATTEIKQICKGKPWMLPYFVYKQDMNIGLECCGTQCLLFSRGYVSDNTIGNLKKWKMGFPREDIYLTKSLVDFTGCNGLLMTGIESWHLQSFCKRTEWGKKDTELGYKRVLEGDISFFIG